MTPPSFVKWGEMRKSQSRETRDVVRVLVVVIFSVSCATLLEVALQTFNEEKTARNTVSSACARNARTRESGLREKSHLICLPADGV